MDLTQNKKQFGAPVKIQITSMCLALKQIQLKKNKNHFRPVPLLWIAEALVGIVIWQSFYTGC